MGLSITADEDVVIAPALKTRLRREIARMIKAVARRERFVDLVVKVRLCSNAVMRQLEPDAGKDKRIALLVLLREPALGARGPVGDIVISLPTANLQAKQGLHAELLGLASCGLCRLLGYDPANEDAERAMQARAAALRTEAVRGGHVRAA